MIDDAGFLLVYGALRSGSTMLRLMLHEHPRLSCPAESDFMFDHLAGRDGQLFLNVESMAQDRIFAATGMRVPAGSALEQLTALAEQTRKGRDIGVMVLHRGIDRALDVFPNIRVVHLLRDPRDVASSCIPMGWAGNAYCGVDHWIRTEEAWTEVQARLKPEQVHEVRYEELVRAPEATLAGICDFAGVRYDPAMMDYDQRSTYAKPDARKVDQWRRRLSPRDIGLVETKLGSRLSARGYQSSGLPPVPAGALTDLMLRVQSKRKVWARKFEDYGVVDPLMMTVAHRMHLPALGIAAKRRIEAKIISDLK